MASLNRVAPGEIFWFITRATRITGCLRGHRCRSAAALAGRHLCGVDGSAAGDTAKQAPRLRSTPAPQRSRLRRPRHPLPTSAMRSRGPFTRLPSPIFRSPMPRNRRRTARSWWLGLRMSGRWRFPDSRLTCTPAALDNPRTLRTAPNGDIFLAESDPGRIRVFRGLTSDGKPEQCSHFRQRTEASVWSGVLSSGT